MMMLMAPAPYHRIVARGEAREDVDRFGVWMVLGAMLPFALGLMADLYVVLVKVSDVPALGAGAAIVGFAGLMALWFGWPLAAMRR
jgi:hypothetical protein